MRNEETIQTEYGEVKVSERRPVYGVEVEGELVEYGGHFVGMIFQNDDGTWKALVTGMAGHNPGPYPTRLEAIESVAEVGARRFG